jgi:hypothetical protein
VPGLETNEQAAKTTQLVFDVFSYVRSALCGENGRRSLRCAEPLRPPELSLWKTGTWRVSGWGRAVNNVQMSTFINRLPIALSPLQERILAALPLSPDQTIPTSVILRRIGIERPTGSDRAAVSRSLSRLWDRGLVQRWNPKPRRQGNGSL